MHAHTSYYKDRQQSEKAGGRKRDRQTERQTDRYADRQTLTQTRQRGTERLRHIQIRQRNMYKDRETDRDGQIQKDIQTHTELHKRSYSPISRQV